VTRSSKTNPSVSTGARRAFGDASNRCAETIPDAKKQSSEIHTLRRSRRLSKHPQEDRDPIEAENAASRKHSLRSSTVAKSKSESVASSKTSTNSTKAQVAVRKRATKSKCSESRKPKGPNGVKRARVQVSAEIERPKKASRKSSRRVEASLELDGSESDVALRVTNNPCSDILDTTDYSLQPDTFISRKFNSGISAYDKENVDDVQEATDYVTDIFQRLFHAEGHTRPHPYMNLQPELNSTMRSILIDWMVEVHMKFRLLPETLYLCINILDRYLSCVSVPRKRLQLVGVTSLLVACKYEEIYPPEVKDCVYITDRAYTRSEVLETEAHIVKTLKFRMTVPTGYHFLQRFLHISKANREMKNLANFYMERMLQEYSTLSHRPSLVAAAAVVLAINNPDIVSLEDCGENRSPGVLRVLLEYTGFRAEDIKQAALLIESKVREPEITHSRRTLESVKRKFESERYDSVSVTLCFPQVEHLDWNI